MRDRTSPHRIWSNSYRWTKLASTTGSRARRCSAPNAAACCGMRSEEHTSELQSQPNLVCRLLLEKKQYARPHQRLVLLERLSGRTNARAGPHAHPTALRTYQHLRCVVDHRQPADAMATELWRSAV